MSKAKLINVGNITERDAIVDKFETRGRVFTKREIIEAQLRGEYNLEGEKYGKALEHYKANQRPGIPADEYAKQLRKGK